MSDYSYFGPPPTGLKTISYLHCENCEAKFDEFNGEADENLYKHQPTGMMLCADCLKEFLEADESETVTAKVEECYEWEKKCMGNFKAFSPAQEFPDDCSKIGFGATIQEALEALEEQFLEGTKTAWS